MRTNRIYEAKEVSLSFKETNLLEFIWLASDCVRLVSENVTIASLGVTWAWTHASCGTMADDYEPLPPGCCWPLETKTKQLMGCCLPRYSTQVCQGTKWEECGVVWQVSTPQCGGFTFANYPSSAICRSLPITVRWEYLSIILFPDSDFQARILRQQSKKQFLEVLIRKLFPPLSVESCWGLPGWSCYQLVERWRAEETGSSAH